MKKNILTYVSRASFVLLLLSLSYVAQAQDAKPTMNQQFIIEFTEIPVNDSYVIDIADLPLTTKSQAQDLFKKVSSTVASYEVDYGKKEVTIKLNLKHGSDQNWDLADWNKYFAYLSKRMQSTYQQLK